ncbi:hypothetical protein DSY3214 [Desulfitobacterium hafniense Y51]|uniref:Uncharacterized protein n=1 Tax=Desulfitobacterium hafniense (strain Y51) TaxID=138119 RepID=Q24SI9_DESHY|nr:hypothetical protein DSY3214 [Desulfitobacterium hafniense Y51]
MICRRPSFCYLPGCLLQQPILRFLSKFYSFFCLTSYSPERRHDRSFASSYNLQAPAPGLGFSGLLDLILPGTAAKPFGFCPEFVISALILYYENLMTF